MNPKTRNIIGWILAALIGALFIFSAVMKFKGGPEAEKGAAMMGFTIDGIRMLGCLELLSVLLFLIPRTGVVGSLLLIAYTGGIMATHLQHHMSLVVPVIIQCVIWITALLRFPELGTRLFGGRSSAA